MRSRILALASLTTMLGAACVEGPSPSAPQLRLVSDFSFDAVGLVWTPPAAGDFTGYAVEVSGGDAFRPWRTFDALTTSQFYLFDPSTPEQTTWAFRVRALPETDGTRVSNEVPFRRGIRPPSLSCSAQHVHECRAGTPLLVGSTSAVADHLALDRSVERGLSVISGPTWIATLPTSATGYVDADVAPWEDCAVLVYRLTAVAPSGEESRATVESTGHAPPAAPRSVTAVPVPGGVRVAVESASVCANALRIERRLAGQATGAQAALLAAPPLGETATFDDLGVAPGAYVYVVTAEIRDPWLWGEHVSAPTAVEITF